MNKSGKRIIQAILFILIIIGFIYIGTKDFNVKTKVDNERFDEDYQNVDKNNVFNYISASEVYSLLKNGTGIIFMGYPSNKWSGYYAEILNKAAKESNINQIYYYDFYEDREMRNGTYQSIVLKLNNYLPTLDDDSQNLYAPTLVIVKEGKIIGFDNETAINVGNINPKDYWNELNSNLKKENLKAMFVDYLK